MELSLDCEASSPAVGVSERDLAMAIPAAYSGGEAGRSEMEAEGWYRDPYLVHEDRWFSAGQPTQLVRDNGVEADDPPPPGPARAELVEVPHTEPSYGEDLRRVDGRVAGDVHDPTAASVMVSWNIVKNASPPLPEPPLDESPSWREGSGSSRG